MAQQMFTVPTTGTYRSADGSKSFQYYAGDQVPIELAVELQMTGAAAAAETAEDAARVADPIRREDLDRLGPRSVKDARYAAIGDGVANDAAALQDAIDAAAAAGGGTVHLPAGTYRVTTAVLMKPKVTLRGDGIDVTTIKGDVGVATGQGVVLGTTANAAALGAITDLTVDGNRGVFSGDVRGIQVSNAPGFRIERVKVVSCRDNGIQASTSTDMLVRDCIVADCYGGTNTHGIHLSGGCHRSKIVSNDVSDVHGMGIRVGTVGTGATDCLVQGNTVNKHATPAASVGHLECIGIVPLSDRCRVIGNVAIHGGDNGISVSANDSVVQGNTAIAAQFHGIAIGGDNITCAGNVSKNNGQDPGANTYSGIQINGRSGAVVTGNRCYDDQGTKTQNYGVKGASTEGPCLVATNDLRGNAAGATNNLNAAVVLADNLTT